MRSGRMILALLAATVIATPAMAQFGVPGSTNVKEKLVGKMLSAQGAPAVGASDQVAAFFGDKLIGAYTFSDSKTDYVMTIYGDDPNTAAVEGPAAGAKIEFRFFDFSANAARNDVIVENLEGEKFNYRYGGELNTIPDGLPIPIDLTPTRNLNLRVGVTDSGSGGSGDDREKYDVDGNGVIDEADAAMVLRMVIGAKRGLTDDELAAADVNEDTRVDTNDAIAVMRNRE